MTVLYLAAHGFAETGVPLGGGAAVCRELVCEWTRTQPFPLNLITPAILGPHAPRAQDLATFNERSYAQFCRRFEAAATAEVLQHDPTTTRVLVNDISEGPDFQRLSGAGFRIITIYHVDVVAYVSAIYCRNLLKPETLVRWYERLPVGGMASLVFAKQRDSLRYSRAVVVPSQSMRDVLQRCYPQTSPQRIHVMPWGTWDRGYDQPAADTQAAELRREYGVPQDALVLLTLSRISPEKGQDLLLEALAEWEQQPGFPEQPLWLFLCGEAAYMQGKKFLRRLHQLATRLQRTRVVFPGHVEGLRKQGFFAMANLYVFPSRHESYGLTLVEALQAGLPALALDHHGAREVLRPDCGLVVSMADLQGGLARLLTDAGLRTRMGRSAREYAATLRFSDTAAKLARLLLE
ncbi:MAG: glycosyltransferase family 4 protein [Bryobacteraceae bacterium]